jgi:hypothetical protein
MTSSKAIKSVTIWSKPQVCQHRGDADAGRRPHLHGWSRSHLPAGSLGPSDFASTTTVMPMTEASVCHAWGRFEALDNSVKSCANPKLTGGRAMDCQRTRSIDAQIAATLAASISGTGFVPPIIAIRGNHRGRRNCREPKRRLRTLKEPQVKGARGLGTLGQPQHLYPVWWLRLKADEQWRGSCMKARARVSPQILGTGASLGVGPDVSRAEVGEQERLPPEPPAPPARYRKPPSRSQISRLKGGPDRPNLKPTGTNGGPIRSHHRPGERNCSRGSVSAIAP